MYVVSTFETCLKRKLMRYDSACALLYLRYYTFAFSVVGDKAFSLWKSLVEMFM